MQFLMHLFILILIGYLYLLYYLILLVIKFFITIFFFSGESGLGKSTLINTLFLTDLYPDRIVPGAQGEIF